MYNKGACLTFKKVQLDRPICKMSDGILEGVVQDWYDVRAQDLRSRSSSCEDSSTYTTLITGGIQCFVSYTVIKS
eukprot:m.293463 g.293463  ORF g.293463 m.293463 type:complete len:75 (+) comp16388_c0_seq71:3291-3515(+)